MPHAIHTDLRIIHVSIWKDQISYSLSIINMNYKMLKDSLKEDTCCNLDGVEDIFRNDILI